jgi:hypothetical protein
VQSPGSGPGSVQAVNGKIQFVEASSSRSNRSTAVLRSSRSNRIPPISFREIGGGVFALGFPSKEALRSLRSELHSDIEPRTSLSERHRRGCHSQAHAANRRADGARIQSAQEPPRGVLRISVWASGLKSYYRHSCLAGSERWTSRIASNSYWSQSRSERDGTRGFRILSTRPETPH